MTEEDGRMGDDGPEFETLASLVEAGALGEAEREGLAAAVGRARAVFVAGADAGRADRLFGALLEEVGEADGRGPTMVPPAGVAEARLESMRFCDGHDEAGRAMAVYDLRPGDVAGACRAAAGGRRVLAQLDASCTSRSGAGRRHTQAVVELVARGLRESGYEGGEGEVLLVYAGGRPEAPGRVSTCWVSAGREGGGWRLGTLVVAAVVLCAAALWALWGMSVTGWSGRAVTAAVLGMVVAGVVLLLLLGRVMKVRRGAFGAGWW